MKFAAIVCLTLGFAGASFAQVNKWCTPDNSYCAQSVYNPNTGAITFAVSSTATGWVGLGVGTGMADADVWVGWNPSPGVTVVSDRTSTGRTRPTVDTSSQLLVLQSNVNQVAALKAAIPPNHVTVIYFARFATPKRNTEKTIAVGAPTSFIYGYANGAPATPADAGSQFPIHDTRGTFQFDFTASGSAGVPPGGDPAANPTAPGGVTQGTNLPGSSSLSLRASAFVTVLASLLAFILA